MAKKSVYELITEQIVSLLDQGEIPWRKPWKFSSHMNGVSGYKYRGINPFILDCIATIRGYSHNKWITFNQMTELGGTLKPDINRSPTKVVFWNLIFEKDEAGNKTNKVQFAKAYYHNMFNIDQIDFPDGTEFYTDPDIIQNADTAINPDEVQSLFSKMSEIDVITNDGKAFYSPSRDVIGMPDPATFVDDNAYWCSYYHELIHASGHPDRLHRFEVNDPDDYFGSESYSFEELVAEFGASFLCARTGIDDTRVLKNSAAYIQGWKTRLTDNPRWWSSAASQAQTATEYILGN